MKLSGFEIRGIHGQALWHVFSKIPTVTTTESLFWNRCDCTTKPFSSAYSAPSHAETCPLCFCYVCDIEAKECTEWNDPGSSCFDRHCNAVPRSKAMTMQPPHVYYLGAVGPGYWDNKRQATKEVREKAEKEAAKAAALAAKNKHLAAALAKVKTHFSCFCFLCNGIRRFVADGTARELLLDLTDTTTPEAACAQASLAAETAAETLRAVKTDARKFVVWKFKAPAAAKGTVKLAVKPPPAAASRRSFYGTFGFMHQRYGGGGFPFGYDSDECDSDGYPCDRSDDESEPEEEDDECTVVGTCLPGGSAGTSTRKGRLEQVPNRASVRAQYPRFLGQPPTSAKGKAVSSSSSSVTATRPATSSLHCGTCGFESSSRTSCGVCGLLLPPVQQSTSQTAAAAPDILAVLTVEFAVTVEDPSKDTAMGQQSNLPSYIKENWRLNASSWCTNNSVQVSTIFGRSFYFYF